ncbi:tail tape measure protein [Agrobacterium sp. S2/73]|uniref:tail tape measure protein n=1 Tax=unclassified Agrobacterium TaxID=2632611 RepID=UPI001ADB8F4C|nr:MULTISPECIES: tail tape measure protein [unclassified Agrobacterium]MBO9108705.1 tail tape measure protein [Agrobacterium sp. S2/73]QXZ73536.1 tail tape measure protein [Agrobacterium sp. S7/73]
MTGDEEQLAIQVVAKLTELEKQMAKANGITARAYREMSLNSRKATKQMEDDAKRSATRVNQAMATVGTSIGGVGRAFAGGLIGTLIGAGISGTIQKLGEVARGVAEIGDQAKIAGVNVKAFQELKFVAEQNRVGVDALQDGLKELSLRADEFIVSLGKSGSGAEAFQRLGYSVDDLKEKLKDPSALFAEIIGRLGQLDKAAQIRISDEIFGGTGGEQFVQLIGQGERGIRDTIQAANDLGIVMDEQLIERAAEVDRRFQMISQTVGTTLKSAIVSAADSLSEFIDGFRDYQKQMSSTLESTQRDLGMKRLDLENSILEAQNNGALGERNRNKAIGQYRLELQKLAEEEAKVVKVLGERIQPMNRSGEKTWTPPAYTPPSASKSKTRDPSVAQAEREKKAVQELIAELEEELRIVGLSDAAKRASAASRQAGAAATDAEREKIIQLTEAIATKEEAQRKSDEATLYYRDLTKAGLDDLVGAIESGKSFWEAMGDVAVNSLKRISDTLLDDVLDALFKVNGAAGGSGGGFLSSLFSGIFGGGTGGFASLPTIGPVPTPRPFAKGGAFADGISGFSNQVVNRPTMFAFASGGGVMGEAGPEAIMPLSRDSSGRLGVSMNGGGSSGQASSPSGGTSEVMVSLSPELIGQILQQAQSQSIKLVQRNNAQKNELYMNGSPR